MDTLETFRVYRATIPLSFLQILDLYTVSSGFYESLNEKNRMCELCTFSQIRSHIILVTFTYVTGFAKTCIVHTSNFSTLKIHKIC